MLFKHTLSPAPHREGRFQVLLAASLIYMAAAPFLQNVPALRYLSDILYGVMFLSAVYSVRGKETGGRILELLLLIPVLATLVMKYLLASPWVQMVGSCFSILFIGYTIRLILDFVSRQRAVTRDVLYAAVVVYLLIGVLWSGIYALLEEIEPGSFRIGADQFDDHRVRFLYFSFVTLTTLGYGDITPVTAKASALVMLQAIVGQLYLVIQVAWLVGLHTSQSLAEREARDAAALPRETGAADGRPDDSA